MKDLNMNHRLILKTLNENKDKDKDYTSLNDWKLLAKVSEKTDISLSTFRNYLLDLEQSKLIKRRTKRLQEDGTWKCIRMITVL